MGEGAEDEGNCVAVLTQRGFIGLVVFVGSAVLAEKALRFYVQHDRVFFDADVAVFLVFAEF